MIVIASANGRVGIEAAVEVLRRNGSALDAVETGIRAVESNAEDHNVGLGGLPTILGEVELDAGLMDGRTRAVGAVAAVRHIAHPITLARQVMQRLPHVLLVGAGAERFADELNVERLSLLTPEAEALWHARLEANSVDPASLPTHPHLSEVVQRVCEAERRGGTVDFLAQDAAGNLAVGVSTSGFAWKYPGRVGDSPIPGAGYYADNRYGAAACTGIGELALRANTAHSVVLFLRLGYSLEQAGHAALDDLHALACVPQHAMSLLALDRTGQSAGFTDIGDPFYLVMTPTMSAPEERPRLLVPPPGA